MSIWMELLLGWLSSYSSWFSQIWPAFWFTWLF